MIPTYKIVTGWYPVTIQNVYLHCCIDFENWLYKNIKSNSWCQTADSPMNQYWFRKEEDALLFTLRFG